MALADLVDEVVGLIYSKLHYPDRVRFGAVCKGWRKISKDLQGLPCSDYDFRGLPCSRDLPWVFSSEDCHLYDPYSQQVMKRKYSKEKRVMFTCSRLVVHASKGGWLLLQGSRELLFLYNPFTNDIINVIPPDGRNRIYAATFTADPNTCAGEFEIFVMWKRGKSRYGSQEYFDISISEYRMFKDHNRRWTLCKEEENFHYYGHLIDKGEFCSMQFMGEKLYLLFKGLGGASAQLRIIDLKSKMLRSPHGNNAYEDRRYTDIFANKWDRGWLVVDDTKDDNNIMLVFGMQNNYTAYKLNQESMSLVNVDADVNTNITFFVGSKSSMTCTPPKLVSTEDTQIAMGSLVFYLDKVHEEDKTNWVIKCFSLKKGKEIPTPYLLCQAPNDFNITFIQPRPI